MLDQPGACHALGCSSSLRRSDAAPQDLVLRGPCWRRDIYAQRSGKVLDEKVSTAWLALITIIR